MPPSFQQKKTSTSRYASRCCCGLALPQSTHLMFFFTNSDTRPSRLDCMRNILGPAARESTYTAGCVHVWIPSWDWCEESAFCSLLCEDGVQAGLHAGSICQRLRRIMQASIMNDLLPGSRFPEGFCGFPTTPCRCFHTLLGFSSLHPAIPRREPFATSVVKTLAAMLTSLHHIQLALVPRKVGTRGARACR